MNKGRLTILIFLISFILATSYLIPSPTHASENYQSVSASFTFDRDLGFGFRGQDVENLQCILDIENPTGYFGPITKQAVIDLQTNHKDQILVAAGISTATGFVGSSTRAFLNTQLAANGASSTDPTCPTYEGPTPQPTPEPQPYPNPYPQPQPQPNPQPQQQPPQNQQCPQGFVCTPNQQSQQSQMSQCPLGYQLGYGNGPQGSGLYNVPQCVPNQQQGGLNTIPTFGQGGGIGQGGGMNGGGGTGIGQTGNPNNPSPDQTTIQYSPLNDVIHNGSSAGASIKGIPVIGPPSVSCNPTAGNELHSYDCVDPAGHVGLTERITSSVCPPLIGWVCGKFAFFGGQGEIGKTTIPNPYSSTLAGLNPTTQYYSAMRWNYYQLSPSIPKNGPIVLSNYYLQLFNPSVPACVNTIPVDWGPHTDPRYAKPRAYDLSQHAVTGLGNNVFQDKTIIYGRLIPRQGNEVGLADSCLR